MQKENYAMKKLREQFLRNGHRTATVDTVISMLEKAMLEDSNDWGSITQLCKKVCPNNWRTAYGRYRSIVKELDPKEKPKITFNRLVMKVKTCQLDKKVS